MVSLTFGHLGIDMREQDIICEFCLKVLQTVNIKKLKSHLHKQLMLEHKKECKQWNTSAATVLRLNS
jgi:hypothetical protein